MLSMNGLPGTGGTPIDPSDFATVDHTHAGYDAAATVILAQDFTANTTGLSTFPGGTLTHDSGNGLAVFDVTATNHYLRFGASDMPAGRIQVTFEVVSITGEWQLGLPYSTKLIDVLTTGRYTTGAYYDGSGSALLKRPALKCNVLDGGVGQIKLNIAYVYWENPNVPIVWHESINGTMLQLGREVTNPNDQITGHVAIGAEAVVGLNGTRTEGYNAQVGFGSRTDTYVQPNGIWVAPGGTGRAAFGDGSWAGAWRTTAVGAGAKSLNVSSEAFGWHCIVATAHSVAIGRGVTVTTDGPGNCVTMLGADLYLDNAWGHRIVNPDDTRLDEGGYGRLITDPGNEIITVHGPDAYDARRPMSVADTAARDAIPVAQRIHGQVVYVSGEDQSYYLNGGLLADLSDNTLWAPFSTTGDKRSLNQPGGKLRLMSGRSTGTGTPGTVSLSCERALEASLGENTKGIVYDFLTLDGQEDAVSATVFKVRWNSTEYRMHVGADGTGPGGTGRALYLV